VAHGQSLLGLLQWTLLLFLPEAEAGLDEKLVLALKHQAEEEVAVDRIPPATFQPHYLVQLNLLLLVLEALVAHL